MNYDQLSEGALLKLIEDKDRSAAKFIYDKYAAAIYGVILKKSKHKTGCDEVLLKTFVSFYEGKHRICPVIANSIFIILYQLVEYNLQHLSSLYISHKAVVTTPAPYIYKRNSG
jgi:hypothetical protein